MKAQAEKAAAPIDLSSKEAAAEKAREAARRNLESNKEVQRFNPFLAVFHESWFVAWWLYHYVFM